MENQDNQTFIGAKANTYLETALIQVQCNVTLGKVVRQFPTFYIAHNGNCPDLLPEEVEAMIPGIVPESLCMMDMSTGRILT